MLRTCSCVTATDTLDPPSVNSRPPPRAPRGVAVALKHNTTPLALLPTTGWGQRRWGSRRPRPKVAALDVEGYWSRSAQRTCDAAGSKE